VQDQCAKRITAIFESILGDPVKYVILFRCHRTEDHRDQGRNVGRLAPLSSEHHPNATHRRSIILVIDDATPRGPRNEGRDSRPEAWRNPLPRIPACPSKDERTDFERETRPEAGAHPRAVAEEGNTEAFQLSCRLV
jgi:hypothetical protein